MDTGSHNKYFWFQTFDSNFTINRFLKEFIQHLVDKYVCVSSFDSGGLYISNDEKLLGWKAVDNVATSPQIKVNTNIPTAGFDEWYVFPKLPETIKLSDTYVNHGTFNLYNDSYIVNKFWEDIEVNQPIIYISDGDSLKIVTADSKLKEDVEKQWCY